MNDFAPPSDAGLSEAQALHRSLATLDSHIDIPWPDGPDPFRDGPRRVDLPKMLRGGLWAGCFAAYIPQGRRSPQDEAAMFARTIAMLERIRAMADGPGAAIARVATAADEIAAARRDGVLAIIPVIENGHAIGSDPTRLRALRALGARYLTLTHNGHNALADAAIPRPELDDRPAEHGGLSAIGRAAIAELNDLGMLVDVSHASRASMLQAAEASRTPIVATHSCMRALCDHPRNLDDEQLDVLARVGGVVQVTAVPAFVRPHGKAEQVGIGDFVDHIDYAVRRIGIAHVGIGSDFDGGGGFAGWHDAGDSANITAELLRRGHGHDDIAALWGGNFLRLLRQAEAAAA